MSLGDWLELKLITREPTSAAEIADLKTVVEARLRDSPFIRRLKNFSNKRGTATYEVAGSVSQHELESIIATVQELNQRVLEWIREKYSELLKV